jgi:hypothetical protein
MRGACAAAIASADGRRPTDAVSKKDFRVQSSPKPHWDPHAAMAAERVDEGLRHNPKRSAIY